MGGRGARGDRGCGGERSTSVCKFGGISVGCNRDEAVVVFVGREGNTGARMGRSSSGSVWVLLVRATSPRGRFNCDSKLGGTNSRVRLERVLLGIAPVLPRVMFKTWSVLSYLTHLPRQLGSVFPKPEGADGSRTIWSIFEKLV